MSDGFDADGKLERQIEKRKRAKVIKDFLIKVKTHSSVDVITNSSTTIYSHSPNLKRVKDIINSILSIAKFDKEFDELFTIDSRIQDVDYWFDYEPFEDAQDLLKNLDISKYTVDDVKYTVDDAKDYLDGIEDYISVFNLIQKRLKELKDDMLEDMELSELFDFIVEGTEVGTWMVVSVYTSCFSKEASDWLSENRENTGLNEVLDIKAKSNLLEVVGETRAKEIIEVLETIGNIFQQDEAYN